METTINANDAIVVIVPPMDGVAAHEGGYDYAVITSVSRGRSSYVEFHYNYIVNLENERITYSTAICGTYDGETAIAHTVDKRSRKLLESIVYPIEDIFIAARNTITQTLVTE